MLFGSKRDSVEAACISEAIRTKRREQDEDGTSLLTFPTILKTPDLHLKTSDLHFFQSQKIQLIRQNKKQQLNWARFVCLLSAEEDQGHKLWCTSTNLQEYDEWIGVEGPQTYGWIVRSKPSNLFPLFFWERNHHKKDLTFQDMREIGVALRNFHLEQWNNTYIFTRTWKRFRLCKVDVLVVSAFLFVPNSSRPGIDCRSSRCHRRHHFADRPRSLSLYVTVSICIVIIVIIIHHSSSSSSSIIHHSS